MAIPNTWAIREVALATFYDLTTSPNKVLLHLSNLKTSGVENTAEVVYARGGRGNGKVVGFSGNREARINLEDCVFSNQALAMMTGNDLVVDGGDSVYQRDELTVDNDSATLSKTALTDGTDAILLGVFKQTSNGELTELTTGDPLATGKYSVSGNVITTFAGDFTVDDKLIVYYQFAPTTSKKITVSSDSFAGTYRLVLDCLVRDASTGADYYAQIEIPKAKMEDNWSISMASEGDPSTFTMPVEVLKPSNSTEMWTMTIYGDE